MPGSDTPAPDLIRELEILLLAHHPIIILETDDDARATSAVAAEKIAALRSWARGRTVAAQ